MRENKFLRIETRGGALVAVFDYGDRRASIGPDGRTYYESEYCLNAASLSDRIRRVEGRGEDAGEERRALQALQAARTQAGPSSDSKVKP